MKKQNSILICKWAHHLNILSHIVVSSGSTLPAAPGELTKFSGKIHLETSFEVFKMDFPRVLSAPGSQLYMSNIEISVQIYLIHRSLVSTFSCIVNIHILPAVSFWTPFEFGLEAWSAGATLPFLAPLIIN